MKQFYVYIMANRSRTLYTGVTNEIARRVWEHKHMQVDGFTRRYQIDRLVYYELAPDAASAIQREKQIKRWVRAKKIALIESMNSGWGDLSVDFLDIRPELSPLARREQERGRRDSSLLRTQVNAGTKTIEQSGQLERQGAQNDMGAAS